MATYRTTWGTRVEGLSRKADGRWRVAVSGETFVEADERLAIARFHAMTKKESYDGGAKLESSVNENGTLFFKAETDEAAFWAKVREEIIMRPEYVAKMTGIEQIAYLTDIKKPTPSVTLEDLGELYATKVGLTPNEASRSRLFWKEFTKAVAVPTVRDIDHDAIARYEGVVQSGGYAPKSKLHRYRKIRTIFAHAIKRGRAIVECRRALDCTAMLEVKDATPLDPRPIKADDFWTMHNTATKADDSVFAAMLLMALNCCLYPGEAAAIKWEEVDLKAGELVTSRPKTGVSRVAVLWPETVKALEALPRRGEYVFNTCVRSYTVFSALASWRKYREAAELDDAIVFSMIRDAGYTAACRSSMLDQARVLAGHRLPGASDHYIKRNPQFVAKACEAIHAEFFNTKKGKTGKAA